MIGPELVLTELPPYPRSWSLHPLRRSHTTARPVPRRAQWLRLNIRWLLAPRHGWCVRLDWPDGSHDLIGYTNRLDHVRARLRGLRSFWSPGSPSPTAYRVVHLDRSAWRHHAGRRGCTAADCPR